MNIEESNNQENFANEEVYESWEELFLDSCRYKSTYK